MGRKQIISSLLLLITSIIWGLAFVAQSVSMDYIEPFTFICLRSVIGGLALLPVIRVYDSFQAGREENVSAEEAGFDESPDSGSTGGWHNRQLWKAGIICGLFLFLANCCQQTGIQYTTAGKAGFITAFYIVIVPVLGIFFRKKMRPAHLDWRGDRTGRTLSALYYGTDDNPTGGPACPALCFHVLRADPVHRPFRGPGGWDEDGLYPVLCRSGPGLLLYVHLRETGYPLYHGCGDPHLVYGYHVHRRRLYPADHRAKESESDGRFPDHESGVSILSPGRISDPA